MISKQLLMKSSSEIKLRDVLNYTKEFGIPDSYILNLYFPKLFTLDKIKNIEELEKKHSNLYYENKTDLSDFFDDYNERIEIFDEIYIKNINFTENGILNIHFTIHPKTEIKLPLEIIFKIINSNSTIPFIKYNPGKHYENNSLGFYT